MFHGQKGELRHGYREGMEDQLGAFGLILNTVTLWNTVYLDHALQQLPADGYPVLDADVARLSPYMRRHIKFHGHYSFALPDLRGARRALRDPDAPTTTDAWRAPPSTPAPSAGRVSGSAIGTRLLATGALPLVPQSGSGCSGPPPPDRRTVRLRRLSADRRTCRLPASVSLG